MAMKTRKLKLSNGSSTSFRLSDEEWKAVERAAGARGYDWPDWARLLFDADPDTPNKVGLLRRAALEEAFGAALLAERAERVQQGRKLDHPMLADRFRPMIGEAVVAELEHMGRPTYRADFTSFELIAGYHDQTPYDPSPHPKTPVIVIRNKLEDGLSCVLSLDPIDEGPELDLPDFDEDELLNDLLGPKS